jgi:NADH-quinone oxidoreductase subunit L
MDLPWTLIWAVLFLPLVGSIIQAAMGGRITRNGTDEAGKRFMGFLAVLFVAVPFIIAVLLTLKLTNVLPSDYPEPLEAFEWINLKSMRIPFEVVIDPLAMTMVLIITGIGSLIHLYATGYMAKEKDYSRFFTYLNLFIAMMLILVLGNNLLMMFIGWEGVGLCSYLLIGFWYKDVANAKAANKAFIVNRIGDWGFCLGMFTLVAFLMANAGRTGMPNDLRWFSYDVFLPNSIGLLQANPGIATAIAIFFFIGAMGKSAQFPLYFWLPDAMAGPTPVSALIHAATMVTAGVFMLNRLHVLFELSPVAMAIVAGIGAFTALFAALIAFGQTDIKKVLAYSTVSQLGFMFIACGVGAFWVGIFHVITHAFFKALLFLGSGAVIASMNHEQDMRRYGNLAKYIKITMFTMVIGWLAIAGFPMLSGFFSKEAILGSALGNHVAVIGDIQVGVIAGWIGLAVALLTAGYMTRLTFLTFFGGKEQWRMLPADEHHHEDHHAEDHSHDHASHGEDVHGFFFTDEEMALRHEEHEHHHELTPDHTPKEVYPSMWIPLIVLAVLSVAGGYLLNNNHVFQHWLYPDGLTVILPKAVEGHPHGWVGQYLLYMGIGAGILGMVWGYLVYRNGLPKYEREEDSWKPWRRSANAQFGYDSTIMDAGVGGGGMIANLAWWFDSKIVDGMVNGVAGLTGGIGRLVKASQSGYARSYALLMLMGGLAIVLYFVYIANSIGGKV